MDAVIDLDTDQQVVWVTEAKYTKGSLQRRAYGVKSDYLKSREFLTQRAETDWVKCYRVTVTTNWVRQ